MSARKGPVLTAAPARYAPHRFRHAEGLRLIKTRTTLLAIAAWLAVFGAAKATDRETVEQRVTDAITLYQEKGVGELCAAAHDETGPFQADEAYVFVFLRDGRLICHPRPDLNEMRAGQMTHVPRLLGNTEAQPSGAWTHFTPSPPFRNLA